MVSVKWSVSDNALTPESIVDIHCLLQRVHVCVLLQSNAPPECPTRPSAAGRVEDTVLIEEGQARSVGCTAAHGAGDAGQKEYSVQADQGHQEPHRDREVSSTHYHPHTPTLHYPLYSITSLPCPPPLLDP